jgi:hypothetical protein
MTTYNGDSSDPNTPAIKGTSESQAAAVYGYNKGPANAAGAGVWAQSDNWEGVHAISVTAAAVTGMSTSTPNHWSAKHGLRGF